MPCPKRKTSRQRRNKRSANHCLEVKTFSFCPNSGLPVMPHTVCLESGYYKGVKILVTKAERSAKRSQVRQAAQKAQAEKTTSTETSAE